NYAKYNKPDYVLIIVIISILIIGTIMVYSASSVWALYKFGDSFYFLKRQLLFAGTGLVAMLGVSKIPYFQWMKYRKWIFLICVVLLIAVLIPGIGMIRGGARSWIGVGAFSIQ